MKTTRHGHSIFRRLLCLSLALYFLNFSVDTRDANPDFIPEDLSFNDIESFSELVIEDIFHFANAFEEHDERDSEEGGELDLSKEYFFTNHELVAIFAPFNSLLQNKYHIHDTKDIASLSADVNAPPPRA